MRKKTSIYLDDELDQSLARKAAEEGITKAELIRRSLEGVVAKPRRPRAKSIGAIKDLVPHDLAENAEQYLDGMGER